MYAFILAGVASVAMDQLPSDLDDVYVLFGIFSFAAGVLYSTTWDKKSFTNYTLPGVMVEMAIASIATTSFMLTQLFLKYDPILLTYVTAVLPAFLGHLGAWLVYIAFLVANHFRDKTSLVRILSNQE